jgi:hypothetical protein
MQIPKLYQWIRLISFRIFLVAFVITLIGMSLLGRWCSEQNLYPHFTRFHQLIYPESLYYPTISQLRALVKHRLQDRNKIGVIVGGSSVFNGVTQTPKELWTNHLQELLGDRYEVINLALRSGSIQGGGGITAQSLLNEGYKIIFTSDISLINFFWPFDGGDVFNYFLWDALYKGLIKNYPPLQNEINRFRKGQTQINEVKLRMWLDSIFYFNDLWTTIGYKYFFTVWNMLSAGNSPLAPFTKPRAQFPDPETNYEPKPVPERYEAIEASNDRAIQIEQDAIVDACTGLHDLSQGSWVPYQLRIEALDYQFKAIFPEHFRSHTLVVMPYRSRYYFDTLKPSYRDCWKSSIALASERLQRAGYWATGVGENFTAEDFGDGVHLVASGGVKLAEAIAPKIQEIALRNGYLK